jgi:hypothetical protein
MAMQVATRIPGEIFTMQAMFPRNDSEGEANDFNPLYTYKAISDPDKMYMHQAMKQPERDKFKEAMQKEMDNQLNMATSH